MRPTWTIILAMIVLGVNAQRNVDLKSGTLSLPAFNAARAMDSLPSFDGKAYAFVDFGEILSPGDQQALRAAGYELVESVDEIYLLRFSARRSLRDMDPKPLYLGVFEPGFKLSPVLSEEMSSEKVIYTRIKYARQTDESMVIAAIGKAGGIVAESPFQSRQILSVAIPGEHLLQMAEIATILWIEPEPEPDELIRYQSTAIERANFVIQAMGLTGNGVTIGIGDGGKVGTHLDLDGQLENFAYGGYSSHATHVSGIAAGSPQLNPFQGTGTAPGANLVTSFFSTVVSDAERHMLDHNMSITNNSYGSSLGNCELMGDYTLTSAFIDDQLLEHDTLLHVFAAGNSGDMTCMPYPSGYATVLTGYQPSKNILCVGSCNKTDGISGFSSRGPVDDGRIKPDIVAVGSNVRSTRPNNIYQGGSGTSYSAPAITGISALVSEQYQNLYSSKPSAALIKAALMNTADDLGNRGPDYIWGYGRVNARRAVQLIADGRFVNDTLTHGDSIVIQLNVPAESSELRVMLLWTDPPAAPFATPALRNDLDMYVESGGTRVKPWVLNPLPSYVASPATRARDSINNQEQVTIEAPVPGTYNVVIRGESIPIGSQGFCLVWEYVHDGITIVYPATGSKFLPGQTERLRWDAYGEAVGPFDIDYAIGDGPWQSIAQELDQNRRWVDWTVPDTFTAQLRLRVSASAYIDSLSEDLTIANRPSNLSITSPCSNYATITWDALDEATHYGIYRYDGIKMVLWDTVHAATYLAEGIHNSTEWFAVSTFISDTIESIRAKALPVSSEGSNTCPWTHDLMVTKILHLTNGRKHTSSELTNHEALEIELVNIGSDTLSNIDAGFSLNGNPATIETTGLTVPPGDTSSYVFSTSLDLSVPGSYTIVTWVHTADDDHNLNDTITINIRQIDNPIASLPWSEGFESVDAIELHKAAFGFGSLDEWDYEQVSGPGRLRAFAGNEFVISGERAITLDGKIHNISAVHGIIATLNLSTFNVGDDDIRLTFDFMHHEIEQDDDSDDIVAIRGNDTVDWIPLIDLYSLHKNAGTITSLSKGIPISHVLDSAGQDFSSSFQIRFMQEGNYPAGDIQWEDGYTFDNIELFEVGLDLSLEEVVVPGEVNCDIQQVTPALRIVNASDTLIGDLNISIAFAGDTITNVVKIQPLADSIYTLGSTLDFSGISQTEVSAWIFHPDDDRQVNDSILDAPVLNFPSIQEMPYFEDFEEGPAGWATSGVNSSFELGSPANSIIRTAASGKNAWVTGLISGYNTNEHSYLTSPCLNTNTLSEPYLSFAHIYELENNYDFFWVEYTTDGKTWSKLGEVGDGYKWYNDSSTDTWDGVNTQWHVASIPVPQADRIQIRFVMKSDVGLEYEGVGIDAVHIHDALDIYTGPSLSLPPTSVSGNEWTHFTNGGQAIASVAANGQDLGDVAITYYTYDGQIRNDGSAYFYDKNIVLTSTMAPIDTVKVRLYFNTAEYQEVEAADDCLGCINPFDPFRTIGRTFSGVAEDSIIDNNTLGETKFFEHPQIKIIPMGEGYAAEFRTDGFSEFWLTSPVIKGSDTIEIALRASSDDASEFMPSGGVNPGADSLILNVPYSTGLRFDGVNIPPGSFISSASLLLTTWNEGADGELVITGQKSAQAEAFTTGNFNITGRPRTDRFMQWNTPVSGSEVEVSSPPLRTIVQEIVDMEGWEPGNAIAFFLEGNGGQIIHAMESDPDMAAKLVISYDSICSIEHRLYVDSAANGSRTGETWADAFIDLQNALDLASSCPDIEEIWIAKGTYVPTIDNPSCSFKIRPGLRIYGGFSANESMLDERDPAVNPVILSGNIGAPTHSSDNAYHVITIEAAADTTLIDGVTIRNGYAFGPLEEYRKGAGVYSVGHVQMSDCIIENCTSLEPGSAIYQSGANMTLRLTNCTLRFNDPPYLKSEGGSNVIISNTNRLEIND